MPVMMAQGIDEGSWVREQEWFVNGYEYAAHQTRAIPALSKVSAEELYDAVWAIMRGAGLPDPEQKP